MVEPEKRDDRQDPRRERAPRRSLVLGQEWPFMARLVMGGVGHAATISRRLEERHSSLDGAGCRS